VQSIKHCTSSLNSWETTTCARPKGNFILALTPCKASNCHVSIVEKVCSATEMVQKRRRVDMRCSYTSSRDRAEISPLNVQANPFQTLGPYMTDENHQKVLKFNFLDPSKGQKTVSMPKSGLQLPV
jgi:hypothetical protein